MFLRENRAGACRYEAGPALYIYIETLFYHNQNAVSRLYKKQILCQLLSFGIALA